MGYMDKDILEVQSLDSKTIERIFSKIKFNNQTRCWEWIGNKNQTGYGRVRYLGKKILVHRLIYAWVNKTPLYKRIDKDILIIDHICNNKACCNPEHLRLTTHLVNMLRGTGPSAQNARKTHCKNGHLLPEKKNKSGRRNCQICNTIWARDRYRRVHNLTPDKFKV